MKEELQINNIKDYCVLDIETTGLSESQNEIIEIGVVKVKDSKIIDTYTTIIKPQKELNTNTQELTNISNVLLQYAPSIDTVAPKILKFIGNDIIVSHNAEFTMKFLKQDIRTINNQVINTIDIAKQINSKNKKHKLSDLCYAIGINNFKQSSTIDCAYLTMCLFEYSKKLRNRQNTIIE